MKLKRNFAVLVILVTLLAGCGGGSVPAEKFVDKLVAKLGKLKVNTADKPYLIKLDNTVNFSVKGSDINTAVLSEGKYVVLDLSECGVTDNTLPKMSIIKGNAFLVGIVLPKGLITIGEDAFDECQYLTSITIPASVTSIGKERPGDAFDGCEKLTSITVEAKNPVFSSVDGVLFDKGKTTLILFPMGRSGSYTIPPKVTSIGAGAFYHCSGLTSVTIPNGVTSIGEGAFSQCENLADITIPNGVTSIGTGAFYHCSSLTSVTIPDGVTSIEGNAFSGCESLTGITIPNGVTTIGERAFYGCEGLTSVTIPAGVTSIGKSAFESTGLTSVTFAPGSALDKKDFGDYAFNADGAHTWSYDPYDRDNALRRVYLSDGAGTYIRAEGSRSWTK